MIITGANQGILGGLQTGKTVDGLSRADERQVVGTLGTLPALLAAAGMEGPTIVVIGAVVALGARVALEDVQRAAA